MKPAALGLALSALWALAGGAMADAGDDEAALNLADQTVAAQGARARDGAVSAEAALVHGRRRDGQGDDRQARVSFDVSYDKHIAPGLRLTLADRLDLFGGDVEAGARSSVNTLKEAYLAWHRTESHIVDLGRVNARYGAAIGFDPTDYFRDDALRTVTSIDPASLRENRLGTVMLRNQILWPGGSLSAAYAPKLATTRQGGTFDPDWAATNKRDRWLLTAGHKFSEDFNPQLLVYGDGQRDPQVGFNLTRLLSPASVAFFEWSGGRQDGRDVPAESPRGFRQQLAAGLTYTTAFNLSATFEYDYNGLGLDRDDWRRLRDGVPQSYLDYRLAVAPRLDPLSRHSLFLYMQWQDAIWPKVDFNAMLRRNQADGSRLVWFEARYRWPSAVASLQLQFNQGEALSEFGAAPQSRSIQASLKVFF